MNIYAIIVLILTIILGVGSAWLAIIDARADAAHARWMARNEVNRERTRISVEGISHGYRGTGLDGRADHTGAIRKHTRP